MSGIRTLEMRCIECGFTWKPKCKSPYRHRRGNRARIRRSLKRCPRCHARSEIIRQEEEIEVRQVRQLRLRRKRKIAVTEWTERREKSQDVESLAWGLAEDFANEKFHIKADYVPTPDHIAESPAFLLFYKFLGGAWQLVIPGLHIWRLSSKAKAYEKLREIGGNAKVPLQIVTKTRGGWRVVGPEEVV